ncbi:GtrA family protein [Fructilactobacillus myrtifloralis]|uniref:GtrA family protein n=1 Tax=Fructilactobacillus myrtifloralis TaxID=2940301 RepID=A0ABY5BPD4_9LACO|nr:GtrA family protein [Fructilactobacillus myrtifloralis]USS85559.1 GtrA family protein [Fructilactobacillus myrtifloralis]
MKKLQALYQRHHDVVFYLFWGVAATVVNLVTFYLLTQYTTLNYVINYSVAWVITVLFAFYTNKYFVFHNHHHSTREFWYQLVTFFAGRFLTYLIGAGILVLGVSVLKFDSNLGKNLVNVFQNVVVIILNYFWAIWVSFRQKA